jgi:hypothetical protein
MLVARWRVHSVSLIASLPLSVCQFRAVSCDAKSEIREVTGEPVTTGIVVWTLSTHTFCCTSEFKVNLRLAIKVSFAL